MTQRRGVVGTEPTRWGAAEGKFAAVARGRSEGRTRETCGKPKEKGARRHRPRPVAAAGDGEEGRRGGWALEAARAEPPVSPESDTGGEVKKSGLLENPALIRARK